MSTGTPKRRDLTVRHKFDLLKKYDMLPKMSQHQASNQLGISQPLLCKLLKQRCDIETSVNDNNESTTRKRRRCGKDEDVERALKEWFVSVREKDVRVNGPLMKIKAEELAKKMGKNNFRATTGWFTRWKKRENLQYRKPQREAGEAEAPEADFAAVTDSWRHDVSTMAIDDNVFVECALTPNRKGTEICSKITTRFKTAVDEKEDNRVNDQLPPEPPSHEEILSALDVLNRGFKFYGENFHLHYSYVKCMNNPLKRDKKQTKIESFFPPK